jgi:hypothetical protein
MLFGIPCGGKGISYMLALYRVHFPCESRDISSGVFQNSLGELPHFISGELPCTYFCVYYAEIGDFVSWSIVRWICKRVNFLNVIFPNKKAPFVGHVCVHALRPCSCLTFKVQILIVLLIFVAMEFLSPYLRKRFCLFRRYWVFPWLHSYKW